MRSAFEVIDAGLVTRALDLIDIRLLRADGISEGFPHYADPQSGEWTLSPNGDWTGGFFVGLLWLSAHRTRDPLRLAIARAWSERLQSRTDSHTIFRGFLFYYGASLGAVLFKDENARRLGIDGAVSLASSVHEAIGVLPLGEEAEEANDVGLTETSIDTVQASRLLVWAADATGSDELRRIGRSHAQRHIDYCVRQDGSICQSASFDPRSGARTRSYTHKGYRDDSTWARAQAWGMLGFTMAAKDYSDEPAFLETARSVTRWWMANVPSDLVARWDFDAPRTPDSPRDTSATAIAAASMLKLGEIAPGVAEKEGLRRFAERTLEALINGHVTGIDRADPRRPGMLVDGCYNMRLGLATHHELVWGTYYLYEALSVLSGSVSATEI